MRAIAGGRLNRGHEDVRGQISRELTIRDTPRDEPLYRLDMLTVEPLERIRIRANQAQSHR